MRQESRSGGRLLLLRQLAHLLRQKKKEERVCSCWRGRQQEQTAEERLSPPARSALPIGINNAAGARAHPARQDAAGRLVAASMVRTRARCASHALRHLTSDSADPHGRRPRCPFSCGIEGSATCRFSRGLSIHFEVLESSFRLPFTCP